MKTLLHILLLFAVFSCSSADEWKHANEVRCAEGIQEACDNLAIVREVEQCTHPEQKNIAVTFEGNDVVLKNYGYDGINIQGTTLYPCDTLHLRRAAGASLIASEKWQSYDEDWNRGDRYERTDEDSIEIYDKDYERKGHIRKEDDDWVEYDKDWNRIREHEEDDD